MAKEKKGFFKEFKEFITRGNVLDMAVGIIVGGAFTAIITALVNGILTPLLQMIGAGEDGFGALQVILRAAKLDPATGAELAPAVILDFGIVISAIVTFLLTALMLFTIVYTINHVRAHAEKIKAKKAAEEAAAEPAPEPEPAAPPAPTTEELLAEIRDLLKAQKDSENKE